MFDGETLGGVRNDLRLQNPSHEDAIERYDIEISAT